MKEFIRKNFIVILAFALPVLFVVILALVVYIPSNPVVTDYDFVYAVCSNELNRVPYNCNNYLQQKYSVSNNKLIISSIDSSLDSDNDGVPDINENYKISFFLHNTNKNQNKEITLEQVQEMKLNGLLTSPDGVSVSYEYNRAPNFLFFDGVSSYGYYLKKGNNKKKVDLLNDYNRYDFKNNFKFIGWVL